MSESGDDSIFAGRLVCYRHINMQFLPHSVLVIVCVAININKYMLDVM